MLPVSNQQLTQQDRLDIIQREQSKLNSLSTKIHRRKVMAPWISYCCCCPCSCLPVTLVTILCAPYICHRLIRHDEDVLAKGMEWCGCVAYTRMPLNQRELCCVICCTPPFEELPENDDYYSTAPERQRMREAAGLINELAPKTIVSDEKQRMDRPS